MSTFLLACPPDVAEKWLSYPLCLFLKGPQWILSWLFKESCLGSPHKQAVPCRREVVDSKMIIKEYRIPLPLTVEEYRIAQLYMIQVSPERQLDQVKSGGSQPAPLALPVDMDCC